MTYRLIIKHAYGKGVTSKKRTPKAQSKGHG